jgi:hypothetical protein
MRPLARVIGCGVTYVERSTHSEMVTELQRQLKHSESACGTSILASRQTGTRVRDHHDA